MGDVSYIYTSSGEKLATKVGSSFTYYRGPFVYSGNELDHIAHPEGIVRRPTGSYIYNYAKSDHTGSTRLLCHAAGGEMVADQTTEYYPYGLSFSNSELNLNRYLYSGKELQDQNINGKMLGLYDFGSRNYDPVLGRWFNVDPALQFTNPYLYCANSPMMYRDPDGEFVEWIVLGGAILGAYLGGTAANENWVPWKWNYQTMNTWAGILGGAIIGGASAYLGASSAIYGLSMFKSGVSYSLMGNVSRISALAYSTAKTVSTAGSLITNAGNAGNILLGKYKLNENKTFLGQMWQAVSRSTWENPQMDLGYTYSQARNMIGDVDNVEFFHGATLVNRNNGIGQQGVTLGNYINGTNMKASIEDKMFMHEYGHTIQGMTFGPAYLFAVGIPSLFSAAFTLDKHNGRWYEMQANRKANRYLSNKFEIEWDKEKYPLNK